MSIELKPTQENIIKTMNSNILGRNQKIKDFIKILYALEDLNIISLDGDWGTGKTFFVKQVVETLKCLNFENYNIDPSILNFINTLKEELDKIDTQNQIMPIYFNAWEYDSNEDPLLTLIYSIIDQNPEMSGSIQLDETIKDKLYRILSSFKVGWSFSDNTGKTLGMEVQCNPQSNPPITKDVISMEGLKQTFRELLSEVIVEKANKLIIFVDELDRCNPSFAVKLLERIKHFFDDDRFIFVFSTNITELQHTIKKFYGEGLDGYSYLDNFFDLQFTLPNIDREGYVNSLKLVRMESGCYIDICIKEMINIYNFSLRKCNRYIKLISLPYNFIKNSNTQGLAKFLLFPILLAVKINDINIYNKIICGDGGNELKNIILKSNQLIKVFNHYFQSENNNQDLTFDFSKLYESIFINKKENGYQDIQIGLKDIEYTQNRKILFEMLSFLNDFNSF